MKNSKVILISATARSGKDEMANTLVELIKQENKSVFVTHFADALKMICEKSYGWTPGDKGPIGRSILQRVGTIYRENNEDVWANIVHELALNCPEDYVIVPDCRYRNEAGVFTDMDHVVVRIERPNFDNGLTPEQKQHISETNMNGYKFDHVITNSGTLEEFKDKIYNFYMEIKDT